MQSERDSKKTLHCLPKKEEFFSSDSRKFLGKEMWLTWLWIIIIIPPKNEV